MPPRWGWSPTTCSAAAIAQCYKARWQIELFCKWIKQHLRIKAFYRMTHAPDTSLLRLLDTLRAGLFLRPQLDDAVERRRRTRHSTHAAVQPELFV